MPGTASQPPTSNQPYEHVFGLWEETRGTTVRPGGKTEVIAIKAD